MLCATLETKCRLCCAAFVELICLEGNGVAYKDGESRSSEDGNAWCPQCLQRMNETCDVLCAEVPFDSE